MFGNFILQFQIYYGSQSLVVLISLIFPSSFFMKKQIYDKFFSINFEQNKTNDCFKPDRIVNLNRIINIITLNSLLLILYYYSNV